MSWVPFQENGLRASPSQYGTYVSGSESNFSNPLMSSDMFPNAPATIHLGVPTRIGDLLGGFQGKQALFARPPSPP